MHKAMLDAYRYLLYGKLDLMNVRGLSFRYKKFLLVVILYIIYSNGQPNHNLTRINYSRMLTEYDMETANQNMQDGSISNLYSWKHLMELMHSDH